MPIHKERQRQLERFQLERSLARPNHQPNHQPVQQRSWVRRLQMRQRRLVKPYVIKPHVIGTVVAAWLALVLSAPAFAHDPASAHDVGDLTDQDVTEAVFRATAHEHTIPECAPMIERMPSHQRACDEAADRFRQSFRVRVEACVRGGDVPGVNGPIPTSYTCTIAVMREPDAPVEGAVAVLYFAANRWNAFLLSGVVLSNEAVRGNEAMRGTGLDVRARSLTLRPPSVPLPPAAGLRPTIE